MKFEALHLAGHRVSWKRVYRVGGAFNLNHMRESKLRPLRASGRRQRLNGMRSVDFMSDLFYSGPHFRTLNVLDGGNPEAPAVAPPVYPTRRANPERCSEHSDGSYRKEVMGAYLSTRSTMCALKPISGSRPATRGGRPRPRPGPAAHLLPRSPAPFESSYERSARGGS